MIRLVAFTALALSMGIAPDLATDTSNQPPTAGTTSPEASKSATMPPSGNADTSGGATEQSSSPSAGSTKGKSANLQAEEPKLQAEEPKLLRILPRQLLTTRC
jgi:hypothetical protein